MSRLSIEFHEYIELGMVKGICGCRFIHLPFVTISIFAKDCKCAVCKQHSCKCQTR
jgi:hypothetical protein